jgi:hypothetical protein
MPRGKREVPVLNEIVLFADNTLDTRDLYARSTLSAPDPGRESPGAGKNHEDFAVQNEGLTLRAMPL